jgi:hypothetical protein
MPSSSTCCGPRLWADAGCSASMQAQPLALKPHAHSHTLFPPSLCPVLHHCCCACTAGQSARPPQGLKFNNHVTPCVARHWACCRSLPVLLTTLESQCSPHPLAGHLPVCQSVAACHHRFVTL